MIQRNTRLVALAGGKGGVGKTLCTANLALGMAARHPTLAVDLDLGCGNLNTCLGIRVPARDIREFLGDPPVPLSELRLPTRLPTLQMVSCSYRVSAQVALEPAQKERLLCELRGAESAYTFLDLGAGVHADILDFFAASDVKIVVTTPESVALHNAFLFLKFAAYRSIARQLEDAGFAPEVRARAMEILYAGEDAAMAQLLERFRSLSRLVAHAAQAALHELRVHILLNMADGRRSRSYLENLQALCRKYLDLEPTLLGTIPFDRKVKASVQKVAPFCLEHRWSRAARAFDDISAKIDEELSS